MDDVWTRDEPESPCQKLCVIHPEAKLCMGCLRSLDEIATWGTMTPETRRSIMAELPARAPRLRGTRRGRRSRRGEA
ncbi:MAG: DUF1289 domain-containing protein [Pseudomonadota bacterium]